LIEIFLPYQILSDLYHHDSVIRPSFVRTR